MSRFAKLHRGERGQVLVLTAITFVALLGMTGLATDVGMLMKTRRDLQNAADAAAFAAVQELPGCHNRTAAEGAAVQWVEKNHPVAEPAKQISVTVDNSGGYPCDTVRVTVRDTSNVFFLRALGVASPEVDATAAARITSLQGTNRLMPWGLTRDNSDCLNTGTNPPTPKFGSSCTVKVGAGDGSSGDYGALDFDGNGGGSSEYRENIIDGTTERTYRVGDRTDTLTGNRTGPTDEGIDTRLDGETEGDNAACDKDGDGDHEFWEIFTDLGAGRQPRYIVNEACQDSPRLGVVPIVDQINSPQQSTILGWALMYLEGYKCVGGGGNCIGKGHWEVRMTMVDAIWSDLDGIFGTFKPGTPSRRELIQ
ncbi:MAG TPA: Tad domain-containing protein [Dehalococcoidia bacterium]